MPALPPIPAAELDQVLEGHLSRFEAARGARIFITGGTGFLGTWLLELLLRVDQRLQLGLRILVLSRDPQAFQARSPHLGLHPAVAFLTGDVRSLPAPPGPADWVLHAATPTSGPEATGPAQDILETVMEGTRATLAWALAAGASRFLYVSSGAVYGPQPGDLERIPETYLGAPDPLLAGTAYGQGKRLAEHLCAIHCPGSMAFSVARGFAFIGPHLPLDAHFAAGNFIGDALQGGPIRVGGDGTPRRSWLYGSDMAVAHLLVLLQGQNGRAYNIGSGHDQSILDLAQAVAHAAGTQVTVAGVARPGALPSRYVPDPSRLTMELGFVPRVDLNEAIRRTLHWQQRALGMG